MARTTSGRVVLRTSLQPSWPWKSPSTVRSYACSIVPMAPSATTTRRASVSSRSGAGVTLPTLGEAGQAAAPPERQAGACRAANAVASITCTSPSGPRTIQSPSTAGRGPRAVGAQTVVTTVPSSVGTRSTEPPHQSRELVGDRGLVEAQRQHLVGRQVVEWHTLDTSGRRAAAGPLPGRAAACGAPRSTLPRAPSSA